jgi:hypothetical protein
MRGESLGDRLFLK